MEDHLLAIEKAVDTRTYWIDIARRLSDPMLAALADRRLKSTMPVEVNSEHGEDRTGVAHLEAFGRLLAGLAPWLELGDPDCLSTRNLAIAALDAASDPASPDRMNFSHGGQPLVDSGFLAQAILRAPALVAKLDPRVTDNLCACLSESRSIKPVFSNWLLFSATVEAALMRMGRPWDKMRVDYAVRQHEQWYLGDGAYGDGPEFRWDYYNSYVIQPMLLDVLAAVKGEDPYWAETYDRVLMRAARFAEVLERLISPEGTFPPIGRSLTYRFGVLQPLGQMALMGRLPASLHPAQVRCAMTSVIRRMTEAPGTFDVDGWLTLGFCGHQPSLAERYISTGSVYLCTVGLLPLGLAATDPFWAEPDTPWTSQQAWNGIDIPVDHALGR